MVLDQTIWISELSDSDADYIHNLILLALIWMQGHSREVHKATEKQNGF